MKGDRNQARQDYLAELRRHAETIARIHERLEGMTAEALDFSDAFSETLGGFAGSLGDYLFGDDEGETLGLVEYLDRETAETRLFYVVIDERQAEGVSGRTVREARRRAWHVLRQKVIGGERRAKEVERVNRWLADGEPILDPKTKEVKRKDDR